MYDKRITNVENGVFLQSFPSKSKGAFAKVRQSFPSKSKGAFAKVRDLSVRCSGEVCGGEVCAVHPPHYRLFMGGHLWTPSSTGEMTNTKTIKNNIIRRELKITASYFLLTFLERFRVLDANTVSSVFRSPFSAWEDVHTRLMPLYSPVLTQRMILPRLPLSQPHR